MKVYRDLVEGGVLVSKEIFDIAECTYTGKDMGERSITATIYFATPIDFQIGDYIKLPMQNLIRSTSGVNGSIASGSDEAEKFYIYTMPTMKKVARAMENGKAFEHNVTFYPAQYELGCVQMRDLGNSMNADSVIYTGFDNVTFNGAANELMERIMMVLKEAYHDSDGNPLWSYEISDTVNEDVNLALERFPISFSGNTVMDALLELNNKETINTTFFINNRKIYVGFKRPYFCRVTDGMSIDTNPSSQLFTFQYGKTSDKGVALQYGGLYDITKTVGREVPITKLFAYGASRNLNRYYCSDRVKGGRYVNRLMLPSFDADGKTDFIISEDALQRYGVREATKQFEEIYPSIRYATYGDIRQVKYCIKVKASGLNEDDNSYPVARVQCYKIEASSTSGVNKLVEAAPPDDLAIYIHAMDKTVKVILCGGATNEEAINKQRTRDDKVPTTSSGTYIPGSCFIVHDRGFDEAGTVYENANRSAWFTSIDNLSGFTEKQKEEIKLNQINYTDTFWLTDLYIFQEYNQTYFSRDGYSAWSWARLNNKYTSSQGHIASDSVIVNEIVHVEPITISDTNMTADGIDKRQSTFDIYLRDLGFTINEQNDFGDMVFLQNGTVKVSILDGLLAGQEFEISGSINSTSPSCICAFNDDGTRNEAFFEEPDYTQDGANPQTPYDAFDKGAIWRIRLNRTNVDEADYSNLNLAMPTKEINAKAGDHLVLLDIFMPDIYIHAAENRLLREAQKYLEANDNGSISYAVNFDKVRMQQIPNYAMQMREGLNLRVIDDDLNIKTENNGRYLANYGEHPLLSFVPVEYDDKQFAFTKNYKKASASIENNSMEITVVLNHDENWLRSPYIQLSQAGKTFDITSNITRQVQSLGWSEEAQGYVYKVITKKLPSGFSQNDSFDIYRNTISNISDVNSKWCSIQEGIDFTRGRYYTLVARVKDYGYFNDSLVNNFALFKTKDDSTIKYSPEYEMTIEHIEGSAELNVTIKFQLDNSFDDSSVYYPSLLIPYDNVAVEVKLSFYSIFERDFDENTTVLNYADFTIDSLTIKITDNSGNNEPIREITATLSEQQNATAWSTLMNKVSTAVKEGEQNKKALEEVANNSRKYTQALTALKNSIFDPDGTCNQTFLQVMMMQIGADSMNYQMDNTRMGVDGVYYNCNLERQSDGFYHFIVYNSDTLRHFVFTDGSQAGNWEIPVGTGLDVQLNGTDSYFVCLKCPKNDTVGQWICSTKQYAVNDPEDDGCWFFNWAILTVDSGGVYTLMETRGNAYMYGDNLVCGKIKTLAGNSYFDLTNGNFVLSKGITPALQYIDGVLTIGGVATEEDAQEILSRLGLLQNDVNNVKYVDISNATNISLPIRSQVMSLADVAVKLASSRYKMKFQKGSETALPPFSTSCIAIVEKGQNVSHSTVIDLVKWGEEYTPTTEVDAYFLPADKEYFIEYAFPNLYDHIEYEMKEVWTTNNVQVLVESGDYLKMLQAEMSAKEESTMEAIAGLKDIQDSLQSQIDGEVTSWFYDKAPVDTSDNVLTDIEPMSEWLKNYTFANGVYTLKSGERNELVNHIGDTYTNMEEYKVDDQGNTTTPLAGLSWRWCDATTVNPLPSKYITIRYTQNGSIVGKKLHWHKIADSDAVKALQEAGKAQATADGKSTIFTTQPSNYSVGDMWILSEDTRVGGTLYPKGTVLNANNDSVVFNYAHWSEDVKYTDDTAVLNLEIGGRNLAIYSTADGANCKKNGDYGFVQTTADTNTKFDLKILPYLNDIYGGSNLARTDIVKIGVYKFNVTLTKDCDRINIGTNGVKTDTLSKFYLKETIPSGTKLVISLEITNITQGSFSWKNVMIAKGNKATDWSPAPEDVDAKVSTLDYLKEALENDTDVTGGIVATTHIQLRDWTGEYNSDGTKKYKFNAGLSGLDDDNVLAWGGGDYEDAVEAAQNSDPENGNGTYNKKDGTEITTLIKKDGTGKIGIFKISDTQAVVKTNQGEVLIDSTDNNGGVYVKNKSGEIKAAIVNGEVGDYAPLDDEVIISRNVNIKSDDYNNDVFAEGSSGTCTTSRFVTFNLKQYMSVSEPCYCKVSVKVYGRLTQGFYNTEYKSSSATIQFTMNGESKSPLSNSVYQNTLGYAQNGVSPGQYYMEISRPITSTSGPMATYNNNVMYMTPNKDFEVRVDVNTLSSGAGWCLAKLTGDLTFVIEVTRLWSYGYKPKTIVATDGIISAYDNKNFFIVKNTSTGQKIYAKGLSATKGTAGSGELYISNSSNDGLVKTLKDSFNTLKKFFNTIRYEGSNSTAREAASTAIDNITSALDGISIVANS